MTIAKAYLFLAFLIIPFFSIGQKRNSPFSITNNFISYRIGMAYPFFSDGTNGNISADYTFSGKGMNYGLHAGIGLGHAFSPKFSIGLSPFLMYSKFVNTDFHYEYRSTQQNILIRETNGFFHYNHLSVLIPLEFNFNIKRTVNFSTGVFILKPLSDRQYSDRIDIDHTQHPPKIYSSISYLYKNRRSYPRGGVHSQFSFLLNERDWQQKRISVEYYHSFSTANFQVYEKWIVVAFKKVFYQ